MAGKWYSGRDELENGSLVLPKDGGPSERSTKDQPTLRATSHKSKTPARIGFPHGNRRRQGFAVFSSPVLSAHPKPNQAGDALPPQGLGVAAGFAAVLAPVLAGVVEAPCAG